LLRDLEAGFSVEEIALRIGRGVFAVEVRLSKLGRHVNDARPGPAEPGASDENADVTRRAGDDERLSG
jgi:hypothetical protein